MLKGINPRILSVALIVVIAAVWFGAGNAVAAKGAAGTWIGKLNTPDGDTEIVLTLDDSTGDWTAALDEDNMGHVVATNLTVTSTQVRFTFQPAGSPFPAHFTGFYSAGDDRVTGTISQRGASRFIKFRRDYSTGVGMEPLPPGQEPIIPDPIRHNYNLSVTGRLSYWLSLHMLKDENYNMNTLTSGAPEFDIALKYFPIDGFNIFVRGFRGGQNFDSDPEKVARYSGYGLTTDSFVSLDGVEFGVMGYFGNIMMRDSKFNPYLSASVGFFNWELTKSGRGSDILAILDDPLEGDGANIALGFGTEYQVSEKLNVEFDFLYRYFPTEDSVLWENPDDNWSNTHACSMSLGLNYGFW